MEKEPKRVEVKQEDKWDLESMYPTIKDWNDDYEKVKKLEKELLKYKGHLLDNGNTLYEYLTKSDELEIILENLIIYANMKSDEDTTNTEFIALKGKIENLEVKIAEEFAFVTPELLKEDYSKIEKFYQDNYDSILVDVAEHIVYCVNTILRKNVDGIIADNFYLFEDLKNLEEIHIYGWSFSSVDIPYLKEIINRNDISKLKWIISWFNAEDKKKVMDFLKSYNINPLLINFVRLIDLVIDTQKKLF